jgi:hypothetical protein
VRKVRFLPSYQSKKAFLADFPVQEIRPEQGDERRKALALAVGQRMQLPNTKDPYKAFVLAADLARESKYQKARDALNTEQERILSLDQWSEHDIQQFADSFNDVNEKIRSHYGGHTVSKWIYFIAKRVVDVGAGVLHALIGNYPNIYITVSKLKGRSTPLNFTPRGIRRFRRGQWRLFIMRINACSNLASAAPAHDLRALSASERLAMQAPSVLANQVRNDFNFEGYSGGSSPCARAREG